MSWREMLPVQPHYTQSGLISHANVRQSTFATRGGTRELNDAKQYMMEVSCQSDDEALVECISPSGRDFSYKRTYSFLHANFFAREFQSKSLNRSRSAYLIN